MAQRAIFFLSTAAHFLKIKKPKLRFEGIYEAGSLAVEK